MFKKWADYFQKKIWYLQISSLSPIKRFFVSLLRIVLLVVEGFKKSQIQQNATALTYYSLLAIVPIFAILLALARAFLFEGAAEQRILEIFPDQKELLQKVIQFAEQSLKQAHQGLIAGIGILLLLWSIFKMLMYIESALNEIWDVAKGRSFARRFSDYLAILFLVPILLFLANGLNIYLSNFLKHVRSEIFGDLTFTITFLLRIVPILITGLMLTFLYIFIPNTRVRFVPAFIAGLITAILYQIVQWIYVYFQIGVASHNAIYGAFAAIPLFLIWLHLSWIIVLLGAKLAFAIQNRNAYAFIIEDLPLHHRLRLLLSLLITKYCIKEFCDGKKAPSVTEISERLSIPLTLASRLNQFLVNAQVLSIVKREDDEEGFQPARDVDSLTIKSVIDMIETKGEEIPLQDSHELEELRKTLDQFDKEISKSKANHLLKTEF